MTEITLPGVLAEISRVAGTDAAFAVAERWGGSRLYVPRVESLTPSHELVEAVGMVAAAAIAEIFHGERMDIPKCQAYRDDAIARAREQGETVPSIARRFRMTERGVRIAMARIRKGGRVVRALVQADRFRNWDMFDG